LKIRSRVWEFQFTCLVVACCIGFPTTILYKIRLKLGNGATTANADMVESIDKTIFYIFFSGVYKDYRKEVQNYFYLTFFLLAAGLALERQSINWLYNRKGCTFNRLQKFIELDLRVQAIE